MGISDNDQGYRQISGYQGIEVKLQGCGMADKIRPLDDHDIAETLKPFEPLDNPHNDLIFGMAAESLLDFMLIPGIGIFIALRQSKMSKDQIDVLIPVRIIHGWNNRPEKPHPSRLAQSQFNETEGKKNLSTTRLNGSDINGACHTQRQI